MFTTLDSLGSPVALDLGDKLNVFGQDLIVNGVGAYMAGWPGEFPLDYPVSLSLATFDQLNATTLVPEYLATKTVIAQIKADSQEPDNELIEADGPEQPKTYKVIYLQESDLTKGYPVIKLVLRDVHRGLMFPGLYTVQFVPYTVSGGDDAAEIPPTVTEGAPRTLTCKKVDLRDQVVLLGSLQERVGDARITFLRSEATQAELLGKMFIDITPKGGSALRYRLKNAAGLTTEQTYHWTALLERVRP